MATRAATEKSTPTAHTEHDTIAAALVALQAELPTVHKGKTAQVATKSGGSYSYDYADLAAVQQAVMPLLSKHGLAFVCEPQRIPDGQGAYELRGVLLHQHSREHREGFLPLFGRQAQELGSSITYARRYLLGTMTGVVTDDDDDAQAAAVDRTRQQQAEQPPPVAPGKVDPWVEARDKAYRRWCAIHPDEQQPEAFQRAIVRDLGKEWAVLTVEDFEGWGK